MTQGKKISNLFIIGLTALLLSSCLPAIESLHNANKNRDVKKIGSFVLEKKQTVPAVRKEAAKLLADYPLKETLPFLEQSAKDTDSLVRAQTAKTLGSYKGHETKPVLMALSDDPKAKVRAWAIRGLAGKVTADETALVEKFKKNLGSDLLGLKLATAVFFAKMGKQDGHRETILALEAPYYTQVRKAIQTLKYYKNKEDIRYLKKFLISKDPITKKMAMESAEYILGKKLSAKDLIALQEEAIELSYAFAAGEAKEKIKEKPTIYIAYPKGQEEIADSYVDFIGYVNSANRTKNIQVIVNQRSIDIAQLWSEFKVEYKGLRGFPLKLKIPLVEGDNKIDVNILDQAGYLVNHTVTVKKIEIVETAAATPPPQQVEKAEDTIAPLPSRLEDITTAQQSAEVTTENFMAVLGDWVKETAKNDYNKGNVMFDQGRFERAAYYYKKSVNTDPLSQAYFNLGLAKMHIGNDQEAKAAFSSACDMKEEKACEML